jgi:hypothetical protein
MKHSVSELLAVQRQNPVTLKHHTTEAYFTDAASVENLTTRVLGEARAVRGDDKLSEKGQREKRREVAAKALAEVDAWRKKNIPGIEANIANERASMVNKQKKALTDAERIEQSLRHSEIRASLRDLDPLQVQIIYAQGDGETRAAIESAPRVARKTKDGATLTTLVRPEVMETLMEERLAQDSPESAEKIEDLKHLRGMYDSLATAAQRAIEEAVPELKASEPEVKVVQDGKVTAAR